MFHVKVLLLCLSSFSVCLHVSFLFCTIRVGSFCVKSISTLLSSSLEQGYLLPPVVASYDWPLLCTRDCGMTRSSFFSPLLGEPFKTEPVFKILFIF